MNKLTTALAVISYACIGFVVIPVSAVYDPVLGLLSFIVMVIIGVATENMYDREQGNNEYMIMYFGLCFGYLALLILVSKSINFGAAVLIVGLFAASTNLKSWIEG